MNYLMVLKLLSKIKESDAQKPYSNNQWLVKKKMELDKLAMIQKWDIMSGKIYITELSYLVVLQCIKDYQKDLLKRSRL